MPTLYEVTGDILALDALLEASGGEWADPVEAWANENAAALAKKTDGIGAFCAEQDAISMACDAEIERLKARQRAAENKRERVKRVVDDVMQRLGESQFKGKLFTITRQKNGGKRTMQMLVPETKVAAIFCKTIPESRVVDSWALRDALENGNDEIRAIASRYARIAEPTYSIRIR